MLCLATLFAYGGRWSWACELLVNFRTHFALLLGIALIVAVAIRRWSIVGATLLGLALNAWPLHAAFSDAGTQPIRDARTLRVVAFNVHIWNDDVPRIAKYLESLAADVVVLEELSPANAARLEPLLPELPHRYLALREGVWGVAILSRFPLRSPRPAKQGELVFAAQADVDLGDRILRLYGVHLKWPIFPATAHARNAQLEALGRELAACAHACLVVGDFNVTPWSRHFRGVLENAAVSDCAAGRGMLTTWPAQLPGPLRMRIDQCLAAGAVSVASVRVGEAAGSDHLATLNDLLIGAR